MSEQKNIVKIEGDGFFVEYNPNTIESLGDVTTMLIPKSLNNVYILNGDHLEEYRELIDRGWDACFDYFIRKIDMINNSSGTPNAADYISYAKRARLLGN